jgi:rhodanese-related sulfurtransferase/rubrerythrin
MQELSAPQLEKLISTAREKAFLIVDVRQAEEYRLDHIPGAVNIPLAQVEFNPFVFDDKRKVIFYCRSGRRSKVAAVLAAEAGLQKENIFHLGGGMMAYSGEILLDVPRVDHFSPVMTLVEVMEKAINFEKGAFFFYDRAKEKFKTTSLYETMGKMSQAEVSHAKMIFKMLDAREPCGIPFDDYFQICTGDILEGGKPLSEIERFLDTVSPGNKVDILEFAIELEFSAYDLYKAMAENSKNPVIIEMFFTLAQAERKHLSMMIDSLELITPDLLE